MGLGDNRSTPKMRRKKAQTALKARIKRHRVEAAKARSAAKPAAKPATAAAPTKKSKAAPAPSNG